MYDRLLRAIRVFAMNQVWFCWRWVGKHEIIGLILLKPPNVTIQGQPDPRKISEKIVDETRFPTMFYF